MLGDKAGSPAMVLVPVCIAQFMAPFMLTAVGVALPSLGRELGASAVSRIGGAALCTLRGHGRAHFRPAG